MQTVDFATNPHAREFGKWRVLQVRYGMSVRGAPPKRRSVQSAAAPWAGFTLPTHK